MKRLLVAIAAAAVLLTGCQSSQQGAPLPSGGGKIDVAAPSLVKMKKGSGIADCPAPQTSDGGLPQAKVACLGGGRTVDLSRLKGPLVLNFWSSTCGPCRQEMPALQQFHEKYGAKVPIIGIDTEDTYPGVALRQAIKRKVTYPLLADPLGDLQGSELSIRGLPTFVFLHADGTMTRASGGLDSVDQVADLVRQQLGIDLG